MSNKEKILNNLDDDTTLIFLDDLDNAIIGTASNIDLEPVVVYDIEKIIEILMTEGSTREEAIEHYYFNIIGGYLGPKTPLFIEMI